MMRSASARATGNRERGVGGEALWFHGGGWSVHFARGVYILKSSLYRSE
jgi:hypothetical protein